MATTLDSSQTRATVPSDAARSVDGPGSGHQRRSRVPEVAVAVLVLVLSALGSLWWYTSTTERTEVLALSTPIERGEVVTSDHLTTVRVATDDAMASLGPDTASTVIGRVALVNMDSGTVLTNSFLADASAVGDGETIVGLELEVGQSPSLRLLPGSTVAAFLTPGPNSEIATAADATELGDVLTSSATVVESAPVGQSGLTFVSVAVPAADAPGLVTAASQNRVRLVQVGTDVELEAPGTSTEPEEDGK